MGGARKEEKVRIVSINLLFLYFKNDPDITNDDLMREIIEIYYEHKVRYRY